MKTATFLTAAASLLSAASARIYGVAVPSTIAPGDTINVVVESGNYIQTVYDVAIAFGISPGQGYPDTLGTVLTSEYLGPNKSNSLENITIPVAIPDSVQKGESTFSASLFSLYGASSSPTLVNYNVSITVGDATSSDYVASKP